jgi:hypothetical protein
MAAPPPPHRPPGRQAGSSLYHTPYGAAHLSYVVVAPSVRAGGPPAVLRETTWQLRSPPISSTICPQREQMGRKRWRWLCRVREPADALGRKRASLSGERLGKRGDEQAVLAAPVPELSVDETASAYGAKSCCARKSGHARRRPGRRASKRSFSTTTCRGGMGGGARALGCDKLHSPSFRVPGISAFCSRHARMAVAPKLAWPGAAEKLGSGTEIIVVVGLHRIRRITPADTRTS